MDFFVLKRLPRRDQRIPLGTSKANRGHVVINCNVCGTRGILPKSRTPQMPVEITILDTGNLEDIEQASTTLLFSKKARSVLRDQALSGIAFCPPIGYILSRQGKEMDTMLEQCQNVFDYQVTFITGRGGSIAQSSDVKLIKSCDACGWKEWSQPKEGIRVDERQWDGSDFFFVDEYGGPLLSGIAVRALHAADLSNFGAIPAIDFRPIIDRIRKAKGDAD